MCINLWCIKGWRKTCPLIEVGQREPGLSIVNIYCNPLMSTTTNITVWSFQASTIYLSIKSSRTISSLNDNIYVLKKTWMPSTHARSSTVHAFERIEITAREIMSLMYNIWVCSSLLWYMFINFVYFPADFKARRDLENYHQMIILDICLTFHTIPDVI